MQSGEERQIRIIVARSVPLWERKLDVSHPGVASDRRRLRRRLERWQEILGDVAGLKRRLKSSNLSVRLLKRVLGGVESASEGTLPSWASTLEAILYSHHAVSPSVTQPSDVEDGIYNRSRPLPFQDILVGLVRYAHERVRTQAGSAFVVLQPSAVTELERQLLAHLTFVASLTIGRDFYEFRFQRAPASAFEFAWQQQPSSTEIYSAYLRHMHAGGLVELLDGHPVLTRLLCQSIEQWIKTSVRFCQRFEHDFSDLRAFFGWQVDQPAGAIAHLRTDLSDRHNGGQTVTECTLHSGERVIYKPRTLRPEIAFYKFIGWLNKGGLACDLKVLQVLDRTTHGWIESVAYTPCQTTAEVERFYTRAGMLLGVLHVLGVTDIHCENLISCGEHPVVVDLETLVSDCLQPSLPTAPDETGEDGLESEYSVLSTGLLPRWQTPLAGQQFDMSALGADGTQDPDVPVLAWHAINTDQMWVSGDAKYEAPLANRVRLANQQPSVADQLPAFLAGFKEMYFFLLEHRLQLLANDGLLAAFDNLELRILVRSTATYTRLHLHLLHPEFLKDGIDRSIELEWLARPLSGTMTPSKGRQLLYECERAAMESLDIPHFSTSTWRKMEHTSNDEDLWLLYGERDSQVIRRRLANLNPPDYLRQSAIIVESVQSRFGPK